LDIFQCYRLLLGRLPTSEELQSQCLRVGAPLQEVVSGFVSSPEFARRELLQKPSTVELRKVQGFKMFVPVDDHAVGREIADQGDYEVKVSHPFRKLLKQGMHVLDIGANIGFYSLLSSSAVGPSGKVWALEPNPRNVALINASRAANSFSNLSIFQAAASDRWELLTLFADGSNGVTESRSITDPSQAGETVQAFPVSAILQPNQKLHIVKIDIEGAEGKALRGIEELLRRTKPVIFTEFTPGAMPDRSGVSATEYLEFFYRLGYEIGVLRDSGELKCGTDPSRVMEELPRVQSNHLDLVARPV
jgi:FkbM family methyltransferase